jgi:hypothetical protein
MTTLMKRNLNVLMILMAASLGGCAADISVAGETQALVTGWQEVSGGALVQVQGALTEDMRFPLRATLSSTVADHLGNTVARSVCRASLADGKLLCRGLGSVDLTVVSSTSTTTTFQIAAMNPGYTDFLGIYLGSSSDVSVAAEEDEPEVEPELDQCTRKSWCFGTTYFVITQDCNVVSSEDDYRCGGGEPVEDPPLEIVAD